MQLTSLFLRSATSAATPQQHSGHPFFLLPCFLMLALLLPANSIAQCSSLYTTPEFPVATHPADGHTQSWGCNLFTPTQFGGPATIGGIQIYVDNSFGATTYPTQTIYMRHTAVSSYPNANYPGTVGFTQVFSGTYNFPMSGLYSIPFNVATFAYNGSQNVEILFENRSAVYRANEPWFRRTPSYGAGVYRSKWNGNFGFGGFPGSGSDGSAVRLTYTLSLSASGLGGCGAILQQGISHFVGAWVADKVMLEWEVEPGDPGTWFEVQRSPDGSAFERLEVQTAGPDQSIFQVWDPQPYPVHGFYRLRQVSTSGEEHYSAVIEIRQAGVEGAGLRLWPNPGRDQVSLELPLLSEQSSELKWVNAWGQCLKSMTLPAHSQRISLATDDLPSGLYQIIQIIDNKQYIANWLKQ